MPSSLFVVKSAKEARGKNKFRIVVSKKIDKRAVVRNRIRRILREEFRRETKDSTSHKEYLIIVRKNITDDDRSFIQQEVRNAILGIR